jgi:hypothetical protein
MATRIAFLREQVKDKSILHLCCDEEYLTSEEHQVVKIYLIKTQGQIADILTGPLEASKFHNLRRLLVHEPG